MEKSAAKSTITPLRVVYFLIGLAVLVYLLRQIDFASLAEAILNINPFYLLLGGVIYFIKTAVRALRVARLNPHYRPTWAKMLRLTLAANLAGQVLPFKLGELAYIYLLKKDTRSSLSQGLSSLLVLRIFDLLAISLLFLLAAWTAELPDGFSVYFYSILVFISFLLLFLIGLLAASRFGLAFLHGRLWDGLLQKIPLAGRLHSSLEAILRDLKQYQLKEYLESTGLAAVEWGVNFLSFHAILLGIGLSPSLFVTTAAVTFSALASVLPVNTLGSFGSQEAGWATAMLLLGFSKETAITSGFAAHLLTVGYMLLLGGPAWLSYLITNGRGKKVI